MPESRPSLETVSDSIDQSLADVLTLMQRFEDTGMNELMAEDYLILYDIHEEKGDRFISRFLQYGPEGELTLMVLSSCG